MTKIRTIKVGQDAITGGKNPHYALVAGRKVIATGTKDEMLELNQKTDGRVWLTHAKVDEIVESKKRPGLWANIHAKKKRGETDTLGTGRVTGSKRQTIDPKKLEKIQKSGFLKFARKTR